MISMAYINGTTSDDMYRSTDLLKEMNYMESCMDSFNKEWSIFESIQDNAIFEASLYGTDINENAVYTEAASDILKKIGDAVISLCKKFVDFVNKIITNIKSLGFNKKSDIALRCYEGHRCVSENINESGNRQTGVEEGVRYGARRGRARYTCVPEGFFG